MRKRRGDCGFPGFASNVRTFSRIQDIPHICFLNITTSVIISAIAILNDMFCHHCHRLDIFHCCHHLAIFHRCHRLDIFHRSHLHARLFNKLFDQRFPICALESCAKTINSTNNEFYQKTGNCCICLTFKYISICPSAPMPLVRRWCCPDSVSI